MQKVTNNSGSNYCKMPDGTLIQWGNDVIASSADRKSFSFSMSFTAVPSVLITPIHSGNGDITIVSFDKQKTSATALRRYPSSWSENQGFDWLAIGRWK